MKILSSKSRGVTLVELSIVLAILGILIVATISGKSLIDMARATATIQYFKDRSVAMQLFDASYSATPGDATSANITDLTPKLFGNGANGINTYHETVTVDYHFSLAKLYARTIPEASFTAGVDPASGTIVDATQILTKSKVSGASVFTFSTDSSTHFHAIGATSKSTSTYTPITSPMFKIIDIKTDDGAYDAGNVKCNKTLTFATGVNAAIATDATNTYDNSLGCILSFSTAI